MPLTHSDIAEIIRLVDRSTLDEFAVEVGDLRVEVRRKGATTAAPGASAAPAPAAPTASAPPPAPAPATPPAPAAAPAPESAPAAPGEPVVGEGQVAVRSPMVGTFYRRPSPDEPPYVDVGSEVEADAPLGLVEVMKLYTTIYAKAPGRIAWICPNDAELVEYDQILFIIDPVRSGAPHPAPPPGDPP